MHNVFRDDRGGNVDHYVAVPSGRPAFAIESKGGKDSFYAVDYAARTASELGADVVKVNFPHPEKRTGVAKAYDADFSSQDAVNAVVRSANRTLVLISGGEKAGDEAMLEKARESMEAGATPAAPATGLSTTGAGSPPAGSSGRSVTSNAASALTLRPSRAAVTVTCQNPTRSNRTPSAP